MTLAPLALVLSASAVRAQDVQIPVEEHTLANGLHVLIVERHHTPRVACWLVFRAGAVDEPQGLTGVAHLLEHMAFKGTHVIGTRDYAAEVPLMARIDTIMEEMTALKRRAGPDAQPRLAELKKQYDEALAAQRKMINTAEFEDRYNRAGATGLNAFTAQGCTAYMVNVPSNKLELYMWLESDRVLNPVLREFYAERDVVSDERRLSVDARPDGHFEEELNAVFYTAHPYRRPVVGWEADVTSLTRPPAEAFLRTYHVPNNATLVLVGDVQAAGAMALAERYFGRLPRGTQPVPAPPAVEPPQHGERRLVVEAASQPRVKILYHAPKFADPDSYALDVAADVLNGRSGRLYRKLVLELGVALSAGAGYSDSKYAGAFVLQAQVKGQHTHREVEDALLAEAEGLKTTPPTDRELEKTRNSVTAEVVRRAGTDDGLAGALATTDAAGGWRYLLEAPTKLRAVTAEDVVRVAKQYLVESNRTVGWLRMKPVGPATPPGGEPR